MEETEINLALRGKRYHLTKKRKTLQISETLGAQEYIQCYQIR